MFKIYTVIFFGYLFLIFSPCKAQVLRHDSASKLNYIERKGTENQNIIIMIHGYGSNEQDLFSFAQYFPNTTFICLRGPISFSEKSYAWYDIIFNKNGAKDRNLAQAQQNVEKITAFIQNLKTNSNQKVLLGGFSQGAILSLKVALNNPELLDGIICFSGMPLDNSMQPNPSKTKDYQQLKAFYVHGTNDDVLPIAEGRQCKTILTEAKISTFYKEYAIKHQISTEEINDVMLWYKNNFSK